MLEKEVTRKQFLFSIMSFAGIVALSKVPSIVKKDIFKANSKAANAYGNSTYGGSGKTKLS
jgi:hypothetical protein